MQIRVDATDVAQLAKPDEFTEFAVVLDRPLTDGVSAALRALGSFDGKHVFVEQAWLTEKAGALADDPSWRSSFDGMVAYATAKGWVDDRGRLRAHISGGGA